MKTQFRDLQLQQVDDQLNRWRVAALPPRPSIGWAKAIREALGISATAFAKRVGMTHAGVHKLETAEASDAITLGSLRKLAQALDCELQYALIPRTSLTEQLTTRAKHIAQAELRPIAHSMALEDQAVEDSSHQLQIDFRVRQLLDGSRRDLWRD
jgi:predicted DNA-binding mobile mystery protein A